MLFTGIGGPVMQHEGLEAMLPFEPFNKMGFVEVLSHLPFFLSAQKKLIDYLKRRHPACLVCVDYSGFNIPMMKAAKRLGIPVVWYIAPMVWAWKRKRAAVLGKYAAHICCIFPFELQYFQPFTDNVHFVGNPVVEALPPSDPDVRLGRFLQSGDFTVALIPGSRVQEVARILPVMIAAFKMMKREFSGCHGIISKHPSLDNRLFDEAASLEGVEITSEPLRDCYSRSDCAVVTSGTATLEAALCGIPHVIVYKTSAITYFLARHFIVLSHIGLPNIIADETVAPELIQQYVTDKDIVRELSRFINDRNYFVNSVRKLFALRSLLGARRPSECVSEIVATILRA